MCRVFAAPVLLEALFWTVGESYIQNHHQTAGVYADAFKHGDSQADTILLR